MEKRMNTISHNAGAGLRNGVMNPKKASQPANFMGNPAEAGKGDQVAFTGVPEMLAKKVPEKLLNSKFLHTFLKMAEKNASLFEAVFVLFISLSLRPGSILAIPGAKKEDKQYAAVKAVATGLVGFGLAALIYMPMAALFGRLGNASKFAVKAKDALKLAEKAGSDPEKMKVAKEAAEHVLNACRFLKPEKSAQIFKQATEVFGAKSGANSVAAANKALEGLSKVAKFPYAVGTKAFDSYSYLVNYGSKLIIGPIDAWILFKLIPPLMNKLFPKRGKSKENQVKDATMSFAHKLNSDEKRLLLRQFTDQYKLKGGQA